MSKDQSEVESRALKWLQAGWSTLCEQLQDSMRLLATDAKCQIRYKLPGIEAVGAQGSLPMSHRGREHRWLCVGLHMSVPLIFTRLDYQERRMNPELMQFTVVNGCSVFEIAYLSADPASLLPISDVAARREQAEMVIIVGVQVQ